jgi:hypothetical protein
MTITLCILCGVGGYLLGAATWPWVWRVFAGDD